MVTWQIYTPEESALGPVSSRLDALAFITPKMKDPYTNHVPEFRLISR